MVKINPSLDKTLSFMIYGHMVILAIGLLTSISILGLSHMLMVIPGLYFLTKTNYRELPKSAWALLALIIIIVLSVIFNQDITANGYKNIGKVKYFIFGFISIAPLCWYFKNRMTDKKVSILLYMFCIATSVATISGIVGMKTGYNYISMKDVATHRNAGLFGMLMNYAHNLAFFQIIIIGLIIYKARIEKFININFLYFIFILNLLGLYLSYTRGVWLGFFAGLPFFILKLSKKWFVATIVILSILGTIVYKTAGDSVIRPESDRERMSQWRAAIMAFKERPVLGYGYLNFEKHSQDIKKRYNLGELKFSGHAHGNIFEMLGSTGLLGCVAFLAWLILWLIEVYKSDEFISGLTIPFIVVFFVCGLTQSTIALGINLFFIFAVYAFSQGLRLSGSEKLLKIN